MSAYTLEQARQKVVTWMAADDEVARKQSFETAAGRKQLQAQADMILRNIKYWSMRVEQLERGRRGPRFNYVVPRG
jgi:hypothetical protein